MKILVVAVCLVAAVSAVNLYSIHKEEWNSFKTAHEKSYASEVEEQQRLRVFLQNKARIAEHNEQYERGLVSYRLAVNKYTDLTHHEFNTLMNTLNITVSSGVHKKRSMFSPLAVRAPAEMDWRTKGAVTAVKDQGQCGSCWAFSTTGALEGQLFVKSNQLVSLSEQNLIDCSTDYDNNGCNGGDMNNAFTYIKENGGIDTESSYPYEGMDGECRYEDENSGATVSDIVDIAEGDEENLMQAVATIGPVAVAIDASQESFQFYSEGVYYEPSCSTSDLDHAVLVVGYGTDKQGGDYWLVKNSWGTSWGDQGYIKMARNKENHCGIASTASYPVV